MLLLFITAILAPYRLAHSVAAALLAIEIVGLNFIVALNGAATNPFSMVLLVPLVLGLMLLSKGWAVAILLLSIAGQLAQLAFPELHSSDGMLAVHSQNMIVGFVLTCILITAVVAYFRLQLSRQSLALHTLRERQLRDEQLLAIGTAAAQLTHDAATPVQTIRLLLEELHQAPQPLTLAEIEEQFSLLESMLKNWRRVADDVRESRQTRFTAGEIVQTLRHTIALARPESHIDWPEEHEFKGPAICADRTLLPALTSILLNACQAHDPDTRRPVTLVLCLTSHTWQFTITNVTKALDSEHLRVLGSQLVPSHTGSGAGAVLSNATIEKFGGEVRWQQHHHTVTTEIILPVEPPQ